MPRLGVPVPKVYDVAESGGVTYLLMEDLLQQHRIPPEDHTWSTAELRAVLDTYARLHGRSRRLFEHQPVPGWLQTDPRRQYSPEQVLEGFARFAANHWTRDLAGPVAGHPGLQALASRVATALQDEPPVVLYNDFYPCNVALPHDGGPAKLFDWQLAGAGPMHLDLQNIGLLTGAPAFARVDTAALLDYYLDQFALESGHRPDTDTFRRQCRLAGLMGWGIFLPRMLKSLDKASQEGRPWSPWMHTQFETCTSEWLQALQDHP